MMRPTARSLRCALTMLVVGGVLAACSDKSPTSPEPHAEPVRAEAYLRGTSTKLADTHDDHWHGSIAATVGTEIEIDVRFLDADDNVVPLGGDHTVQVEIAAGQPGNVASVASHGDHIEVSALTAGETRILIHFWHGGHADWSTPPLKVVVTDP